MSFLEGVVTVPGDGGWIMVEAEQDPKKADPKTCSRLGMRHWLGRRHRRSPKS